MLDTVREVVADCECCQRREAPQQPEAGLMREHEAFERMSVVAFDYVGPLPETLLGKQSIIAGIDHFTRFVMAKPARDQNAANHEVFPRASGEFRSATNHPFGQCKNLRQRSAQFNLCRLRSQKDLRRGESP